MVQTIFYVKLLLIHKIRYFSSILNVSADSFGKHEFFQPGVVQQTQPAERFLKEPLWQIVWKSISPAICLFFISQVLFHQK